MTKETELDLSSIDVNGIPVSFLLDSYEHLLDWLMTEHEDIYEEYQEVFRTAVQASIDRAVNENTPNDMP